MGTPREVAYAAEELLAFGEGVLAESTTNLKLLEKIDSTIDWLVRLRQRFQSDNHYAEKLINLVRECQTESEFDPEDKTDELFQRAEKAVMNLYGTLRRKQTAARGSTVLIGDDQDAVVSEYEQTINALGQAHECMQELRWAIMTHDGRVCGIAASFDSSEGIKDYLMKL